MRKVFLFFILLFVGILDSGESSSVDLSGKEFLQFLNSESAENFGFGYGDFTQRLNNKGFQKYIESKIILNQMQEIVFSKQDKSDTQTYQKRDKNLLDSMESNKDVILSEANLTKNKIDSIESNRADSKNSNKNIESKSKIDSIESSKNIESNLQDSKIDSKNLNIESSIKDSKNLSPTHHPINEIDSKNFIESKSKKDSIESSKNIESNLQDLKIDSKDSINSKNLNAAHRPINNKEDDHNKILSNIKSNKKKLQALQEKALILSKQSCDLGLSNGCVNFAFIMEEPPVPLDKQTIDKIESNLQDSINSNKNIESNLQDSKIDSKDSTNSKNLSPTHHPINGIDSKIQKPTHRPINGTDSKIQNAAHHPTLNEMPAQRPINNRNHRFKTPTKSHKNKQDTDPTKQTIRDIITAFYQKNQQKNYLPFINTLLDGCFTNLAAACYRLSFLVYYDTMNLNFKTQIPLLDSTLYLAKKACALGNYQGCDKVGLIALFKAWESRQQQEQRKNKFYLRDLEFKPIDFLALSPQDLAFVRYGCYHLGEFKSCDTLLSLNLAKENAESAAILANYLSLNNKCNKTCQSATNSLNIALHSLKKEPISYAFAYNTSMSSAKISKQRSYIQQAQNACLSGVRYACDVLGGMYAFVTWFSLDADYKDYFEVPQNADNSFYLDGAKYLDFGCFGDLESLDSKGAFKSQNAMDSKSQDSKGGFKSQDSIESKTSVMLSDSETSTFLILDSMKDLQSPKSCFYRGVLDLEVLRLKANDLLPLIDLNAMFNVYKQGCFVANGNDFDISFIVQNCRNLIDLAEFVGVSNLADSIESNGFKDSKNSQDSKIDSKPQDSNSQDSILKDSNLQSNKNSTFIDILESSNIDSKTFKLDKKQTQILAKKAALHACDLGDTHSCLKLLAK
ncbi:hypothetical protein DCO58_00030 [Helicobacter saguini]|uniref:Uncharacterized protein n=1 Tax=Helicobacter saguini TaxID=1548018 RepID=A0A347VQP3_9HELI|nr:hypothetical protein [Helicobacter saguini]MWV63214.1 hypothetical protein [Helicobacter saguini]MWV66117.1 hypothetical protein [Helicobacter saguini]MWV68467.1 hypothetical protein [Helicobacter saguini]MWV71979.1 hypothetical protein [Helicobacter saguini]TLD95986.1 hypothetical protein LS64_001120 [Helicobacter saguini]